MISSKIRKIKKVAVLGSGVMGSRLACHFANIGLEVLLLDIVPPDLSEQQATDKRARNRITDESLKAAIRSNPSPLYTKGASALIRTGNFEDDMEKIGTCDWILEAIIERLDIKQKIFETVDKFRKPGTLVSSNTSGIPIEMMLSGRSEDFQQHFCGTHFFNPPRYLELLEIIPSSKTHQEVIDFHLHYGDLFLGKKTVLCKDTPAFIANRVGVFSIMVAFHLMKELEMTVEEIDALSGPVIGRPKSATFRTCDLVGIDTLVKVAVGVKENCPDDESAHLYQIPEFLNTMVEKKWIGDKSGQGFYKKDRDKDGNRMILALDLNTLEYRPAEKPRFESIGMARQAANLEDRLKAIVAGKDKASEFFRRSMAYIFSYVAHRIPEISDSPYQIDDALKSGFGWEIGPFEMWDLFGFERVKKWTDAEGISLPDWIIEAFKDESFTFYRPTDGQRLVYQPSKKEMLPLTSEAKNIVLKNFGKDRIVWSNSGCALYDIGDQVLCLEFRTKMNAIGGEIMQGINKSIEIAETGDWRGLVIGNNSANFSAGANLAMILMLAIEQEYDELNLAIKTFQKTVMRIRYSSVPVVIAAHGLTLGGGCEMSLHADSCVAAAETYIGLVEFGAGVIPGGGGTKEFVVRTSDSFYPGDPQLPTPQNRFTTIATAKVATSGHEAFELGFLHNDKDRVVVNKNRLIAEAADSVIELSDNGYVQAPERDDILVLGRTALGGLYSGVEAFNIGNYATAHDKKIAKKLAWVMAGGDLSEPTRVTEWYLLDLEREAFLSLLGERKTLDRMQHILKTGKPLRN